MKLSEGLTGLWILRIIVFISLVLAGKAAYSQTTSGTLNGVSPGMAVGLEKPNQQSAAKTQTAESLFSDTSQALPTEHSNRGILIPRRRDVALQLQRNGILVQDNTPIARILDRGSTPDGMEHFEVVLPDGQKLAKVSFSPAVDAREFTIELPNGFWHAVRREKPGKLLLDNTTDRHADALSRILPWMVSSEII